MFGNECFQEIDLYGWRSLIVLDSAVLPPKVPLASVPKEGDVETSFFNRIN